MTTPPGGWASPDGSTPPEPPAAAPAGAAPGWPPHDPSQQPLPPPPVTPGVVPLRPLALGELLDGAIKVVRRYPRPTLGLAAIVAVATTLLNVVAVLLEDASSFVAFSSDLESGDELGAGIGSVGSGVLQLVGGLVSALGGLVLTGFLVHVVGKAVLGQEATFSETWQQVRPRLWALLGVSLLVFLLWGGVFALGIAVAVVLGLISPGLLFLGVPLALATTAAAVWLYVRLSLAPAVLVLEKAGVRTAMRRSALLVSRDWWRCFGVLLLVAVLGGIVSSVLTVPFGIAGALLVVTDDGGAAGQAFLLLMQVASGLVSVLVSPFTAGARSLLYVDRRMRAEGLDLTLQAAARG